VLELEGDALERVLLILIGFSVSSTDSSISETDSGSVGRSAFDAVVVESSLGSSGGTALADRKRACARLLPNDRRRVFRSEYCGREFSGDRTLMSRTVALGLISCWDLRRKDRDRIEAKK